MSEKLEQQMPTLTLEPFKVEEPVEEVKEEVVEEKKVEPAKFDESILTEQERQMVDDFAKKIDIENTNMILQYGADAQKKMSEFSEVALNNVQTKDLGEIGNDISDLLVELKGFDADEEEKGFLGLFKKASNRIESLKARYAKAEVNVDKIVGILENHQITLFKDIALLDQMYEKNLVNFKELYMYILDGKKKLEECRATTLKELAAKAQATGLPEDSQKANDYAQLCDRFEKKLHDLELTRMISVQMAPQIRLIQNNDTLMAEKIQSTIVNTIPLWKSQMVLALGVDHAKEAMEAQREVTEMTNELLRKNADTLKMATIEVAKESERGIVDIETLMHTNEQLISTFDEVLTIQKEGRAKRAAAEVKLREIEGELKAKLLEMTK
ncbi:MAG: toxic anion resistance protein [Erysipelotrichales bacterium]|nr:toxic anion resistance protein [Erysipelotrichales bacterium]